MKESKKTIVLVHGSWHGAWSWEKTISHLQSERLDIIAFDLPGHGSDKTDIKKVTFDAYVKKVQDEISKVNDKVILVGHSLGGMIVSKVAEDNPEKIEKICFVAAMIPYKNKNTVDILNEDSESMLLSNLIFSEDNTWATVSEDTLKNIVYNGASKEQINESSSKLVKQATEPFYASVETTYENFGRIKKAYIICSLDKIISKGAQEKLIQISNIEEVYSIPTGHVPMISEPEKLSSLILKMT